MSTSWKLRRTLQPVFEAGSVEFHPRDHLPQGVLEMVTHGCGASITDDVPAGAKTLTSKACGCRSWDSAEAEADSSVSASGLLVCFFVSYMSSIR